MIYSESVRPLHIILGEHCTFSCRHCSNKSGPLKKNTGLSDDEKALLIDSILSGNFDYICFVGGEPTLYMDDISYLMSDSREISHLDCSLTTNGWFATSKHRTYNILNNIPNLNKVIYSYDGFHKEFTKIDNGKFIESYCIANNLEFSVSAVIQEPLEIVSLSKEWQGRNIEFRKSLSAGRAKENQVEYKFSNFDSTVLTSKCPALFDSVYHFGKGYSHCCSDLVNNDRQGKYFSETIGAYKNGQFYTTLKSQTFGEQLENLSIAPRDLKPEHSDPCKLCEFIQCQS